MRLRSRDAQRRLSIISKKKRRETTSDEKWIEFNAEAAYADSIFRLALGDLEGSIECLQQAIDLMPTYAPAILSMGSVEYQRDRRSEGRKLFLKLLTLPNDTEDLCEIVDEAGTFLIQIGEYTDGLELYRKALTCLGDVAVFYQGLGCCAGHKDLHEEAVQASRRAVELEPQSQQFVNDLGWSLLEAGDLIEAKETLERAVEMDPQDELARENLRRCNLLTENESKSTNDA